MLTVEDLKKGIVQLPEREYRKLRTWFSERDWNEWDTELEQDVQAGKLDFLIDEALREKKKQTLRNL